MQSYSNYPTFLPDFHSCCGLSAITANDCAATIAAILTIAFL